MVESAKLDTIITSASAPQDLEEPTVKKVSTAANTLTFPGKEGVEPEFAPCILELNLCMGISLGLSVVTVCSRTGQLLKIDKVEYIGRVFPGMTCQDVTSLGRQCWQQL